MACKFRRRKKFLAADYNNIYEIFYFGEDTKSELDQKSILKCGFVYKGVVRVSTDKLDNLRLAYEIVL